MKKFKKFFAVVCAGAMLLSSMTVMAGQDASTLADGTAYLNINLADWSDFEATYENAEVTGDGQYTVSMTAAEAIDLGDFNALEIKNGESVLGTAAVVTVDSIQINGAEYTLAGDSYTCSADGAGVDTRVNIYNAYNDPDATAVAGDDNHADQRTAAADLTACTARLIADGDRAGVTTLSVTFTVSGFGTNAEAGEASSSADAVDLDGTYNAYLGIQGPKYSFRDAWNNESTGRDWEFFNQITKQGDTAGGEKVPADITDAEIKGNGTYTVKINNIEWPDDEFSDQDYCNLIFVSTDIPNDGSISVSDIKLTINGSEVEINPVIDPDDTGYVVISIQNVWDTDNGIAEIGYYATPFTDIECTFTLSGFNYDNTDAVEETSDDATTDVAEEETSNGVNPVVVVVIVVVIVAIVVAAVVVAKKKKSDK